MTFTKIENLTGAEALALASVEFKNERFTSAKLTTFLCSLLNESFQPGKIRMVEDFLQDALGEELVELAAGPRGGVGYRVTLEGSIFVTEIDLPAEKFQRRSGLDDERQLQASANIGPVFEQVIERLPVEKASGRRDREFVHQLVQHWLDHGWMSKKQCTALAEIAERSGLYIEGRHFIGSSLDDWREPYVDAAARQRADIQARANAAAAARDAERKARELAKAALNDANRQIRDQLVEMERNGLLDKLDLLVSEVFPGTALSPSARASAFAGRGGHKFRICAAAMGFGKPPSQVWQSDGSYRQLGDDSEEWKLLIAHPAFRAMKITLHDGEA